VAKLEAATKEMLEKTSKRSQSKSFFNNSSVSRPSRSIMREAYPLLLNNGKLKRQVPGIKQSEKPNYSINLNSK